MKIRHLAAVVLVLSIAVAPLDDAQAQEGSLVNGGLGNGSGLNPLGNVSLLSGNTAGTSAGTYVTAVDEGNGVYTLHFIETDAAGVVISHTTETHNGAEVTSGREFTNGETLGDVIAGMDGTGTESYGSSDPFGCLSFYCEIGDGDPFSESAFSSLFGDG